MQVQMGQQLGQVGAMTVRIFLLQSFIYNFASTAVSFCWQFLFALSDVPNKYLHYYFRVAQEEANINGRDSKETPIIPKHAIRCMTCAVSATN